MLAILLMMTLLPMNVFALDPTEKQLGEDTRTRKEIILDSFIKSLNREDKLSSDEISCKPLKGGLSGAELCRFDLEGKTYVLRVFKDELSEKDARRQNAIAKSAGDQGVAPKVYFIEPHLYGVIIEYVRGKTLTIDDFDSEKAITHFGQTLNRLHNSPIDTQEKTSPFDSFHILVRKANKNARPLPSQFHEVEEDVNAIEEALKCNPVPDTLTHLDLHSQNVLYNGKDFFFIDWENAGLSDPYFDLSMFPLFMGFNSKQTEQFLTAYFGHPPTQKEWDRYLVSQPIHLFWRAATMLADPGEKKTQAYYEEQLKNGHLPSFQELVAAHQQGALDWPRWKIGLVLMGEGLTLYQSQDYQSSLKRLKNECEGN